MFSHNNKLFQQLQAVSRSFCGFELWWPDWMQSEDLQQVAFNIWDLRKSCDISQLHVQCTCTLYGLVYNVEDVWNSRRCPGEYISLGIYPFSGYFWPPPSWCQLHPDRFFISAAPLYMCCVCVHMEWKGKTVEGEAAHFHMSIPDLPPCSQGPALGLSSFSSTHFGNTCLVFQSSRRILWISDSAHNWGSWW